MLLISSLDGFFITPFSNEAKEAKVKELEAPELLFTALSNEVKEAKVKGLEAPELLFT
jgi:hypothetical protein